MVKGDDYRVFLTEIGDCGGLYVSRKGPHRFEVRSRAGAGATGLVRLPGGGPATRRRRQAHGEGRHAGPGELKHPEKPADPPPRADAAKRQAVSPSATAALLDVHLVGVEQRLALLLALGLQVVADADVLAEFGRVPDEQDLLRPLVPVADQRDAARRARR